MTEFHFRDRRMDQGYPDLQRLGLDRYADRQLKQVDRAAQTRALLKRLDRLVNLELKRRAVVLGCGPNPQTVKVMRDEGFRVTGVEPHAPFVRLAGEYLGDLSLVKEGWAEELPLANNSQDVIFMESVLEHVISPRKSLEEAFRVQAPGGVLYITTTNRFKFRLSGRNGEFNVPFYNWFPRLVKESYVFKHHHFQPDLANWTTWPAVHWFSYSDLCTLGRDVGYDRFYSLLDLMRPEDPGISGHFMRRNLLGRFQTNPWLRSIALTQLGGTIFMLKRA